MSGICGLVDLEGQPVVPSQLHDMKVAMSGWGPDGAHSLCRVEAGFCSLHLSNGGSTDSERPFLEDGILLTSQGRLDYRDDLCARLEVDGSVSDGQLILESYRKWGDDCVQHLVGDWSLALWDLERRRLLLARDHHGNTALYFAVMGRTLAFASSLAALLVLPGVDRELDEASLADLLVAWPGSGRRTVYRGIERVPPSHRLVAAGGTPRLQRYWRMEDCPPIDLGSSRDYIDLFVETFEGAVAQRTQSAGRVGVSLSGGLDSGAVCALAAPLVKDRTGPLLAYTSVPAFPLPALPDGFIGDEGELAACTAGHVGNVKLQLLSASNIGPLAGIRQGLGLHRQPVSGASNYFWLIALLGAARDQGVTTLLTGQGGNSTVSWPGAGPIRSVWDHLARGDLAAACKAVLPDRVKRAARRRRRWGTLRPQPEPWLRNSPIRAEFARRIRLGERMREAGYDPEALNRYAWTPQQYRFAGLGPGTSLSGSAQAELGAGFGLEIRDPTVDKRLIEVCLGIPNRIYRPREGTTRNLIRAGMQGRLPTRVLNNQDIALQAADTGRRVRAQLREWRDLVEDLGDSSGVGEYIDLDGMRGVLESLGEVPSLAQARRCGTILERGAMAGLFLQGG